MTTVSDMVRAFRSDHRDDVAPYLWSDDDIIRYLNTSIRRVCLTSGFGYDDDQNFVYQLDADTSVSMPDTVIQVKDAYRTDTGKRIGIMSAGQVRDPYSTREGALEYLLKNMHSHTYRGYPKMTETVDIRFVVIRIPDLYTVGSMNEPSPVIPLALEVLTAISLYMRFMAYGKDDAETKNENEQMRMLSLYEDALRVARIGASRAAHRIRAVSTDSLW